MAEHPKISGESCTEATEQMQRPDPHYFARKAAESERRHQEITTAIARGASSNDDVDWVDQERAASSGHPSSSRPAPPNYSPRVRLSRVHGRPVATSHQLERAARQGCSHHPPAAGTSRSSSARGRRCWSQRRCNRVDNGRPFAPGATISPSRIIGRLPTASAISANSGNVRDTSAPFRKTPGSRQRR